MSREASGPLLVLTSAELEVLERAHLAELGGEIGTPGATGSAAGTPHDPSRDGRTPGLGDEVAPAASSRDAAALAEARGSLVGRGLLTTDGALAAGSVPADLLRLVLDVRLSAQTLVVAERFLGGSEERPDLRLLHLVPGGGVVEDVHPDGLHGLELCLDPESLTRSVVDAVVPEDARPGTGAPRVVDATTAALLPRRLDDPVVLAELTRVRDGDEAPSNSLLAAGPAGCFMASRPGRDEDDRRLTFDPVGPERVGTLVGAWVEEVVRPVCADET